MSEMNVKASSKSPKKLPMKKNTYIKYI